MRMPFVSIYTPTYNRKHTLPRLYESLLSQTDHDFEWVIIDDGSTDGTEELIRGYIRDTKQFKIRYKKPPNKGMHFAVNAALDIVEGYMTFVIGSDDFLTNNAVERIKVKERGIRDDKRFAGIVFCLDDVEGQPIGSRSSSEYIDAAVTEVKKYNITGDKVQVYYTELLTKHRVPEFDGEKFSEMSLLFCAVADDGYKLRWHNEVIYIAEYSEGGLTKSGDQKYKISPRGRALYINSLMKRSNNYFEKCLLQSLYARQIYGYKNLRQAVKDLESATYVQMFIGVVIRRALGK